MSIVYAGLAGLGCGMAYGLDPMGRKEIDSALAERSGLKTEDVIKAVSEAEGKIREIELDARELHNRELTERLTRIAAEAREGTRPGREGPRRSQARQALLRHLSRWHA